MHFVAPFFIIIGAFAVIAGLLWLVGVGSEDDGGPDRTLFFFFGAWYIGARVLKAFANEPMSVLPAFGLIAGGGASIWLGIAMR